jgi:hypothetical protein
MPPGPHILHDMIRKILSYRGDETEINFHNLSYKTPVSMGDKEIEKDNAIYDVCMHSDILSLCDTFPKYPLFIIELTLE